MDAVHTTLVVQQVVGLLLWLATAIVPLVVLILVVKWLYESKKSLAEIPSVLNELAKRTELEGRAHRGETVDGE